MKLGAQSSSGRWFLLPLALSCVTILALVFSLWELIEHRYFRNFDYVTLHYLYITRGITSSLLVGLWAAWFVLRERRHHEKELEQSYERYRSILKSTPEAVVLFDENFRVVEWNLAAERLYGLSQAQALGKMLPTVPPELWPELRATLERVEQGVLDHETQRLNAQGERIPVAVSYSRIPSTAGQPAFFLEVAQDIGPRLRLRDKLLEVEKLTLLGQMTAGTAHHLNTPLTAMLLQTEMLRRQFREGLPAAELTLIEERIRFCQAFVQNLLRFGHRPQLQRNPTSLCEVIDAVVTLLRPGLELKKADLRADLERLRGCRILGDRNHLEVMFSALLSNAVDAIPEGGVIRIHGSVNGRRQVEIHIEDRGAGIPEEIRPRIFEPFFTTRPAGQGTGLGLAIARNIVDEHAGTLRLENRDEGGVRATVELPLMAEAVPASAAGEVRP